MIALTNQEIATIKARIASLEGEQAELKQVMLTAQDDIKGCEHGQASQRDIDAAEHAELVYSLWQEEFAAELKQLQGKLAHLPKPYFKLQSHI